MDSNKIKKGLGRGLSSLIGETKVDIQKSPNGKGKIIVNFNSDVDLDRIIELLKK